MLLARADLCPRPFDKLCPLGAPKETMAHGGPERKMVPARWARPTSVELRRERRRKSPWTDNAVERQHERLSR